MLISRFNSSNGWHRHIGYPFNACADWLSAASCRVVYCPMTGEGWKLNDKIKLDRLYQLKSWAVYKIVLSIIFMFVDILFHPKYLLFRGTRRRASDIVVGIYVVCLVFQRRYYIQALIKLTFFFYEINTFQYRYIVYFSIISI